MHAESDLVAICSQKGLLLNDLQPNVNLQSDDSLLIEPNIALSGISTKPSTMRWLSFSWIAGSLAASVLIAMSGAIAYSVFAHHGAVDVDRHDIAHLPMPERAPSKHPAPAMAGTGGFGRPFDQPAPKRVAPLTSVDSLAEESPHGNTVDDEIAALGQVTALVKHDWYVQSTEVGAIQRCVVDLEKEMSDSSL